MLPQSQRAWIKASVVLVVLAGLAVWGVWGVWGIREFSRMLPAAWRHAAPAPAPESATAVGDNPDDWHGLRWVAIGGGPTPEYNEASIEQDIAVATRVLGAAGKILFAGGAAAVDVREFDRSVTGDPLLLELGDLFAPRSGRDSRYRSTVLQVAGAATRDNAEAALKSALADGETPLLVYLAGHGDHGDKPRDNTMGLWAGGSISAAELAELLDAFGRARPVQLVVTTCYGGGFADVVFTGADPALGAAQVLRCGFFATSADLPAAGCDPNPEDDAQHASYVRHFWHALVDEDDTGHPLPLATLDLDGDGVVSPLEAHTRARLMASDVDVPTTTSERWLRAKAPEHGPRVAAPVAEDEWLIRELGRQTGLGEDRQQLQAQLKALEQQATRAQTDADDRRADEDDTFAALAGALLARWPILDDPWHPGFTALVSGEHDAIATFLALAPERVDYRQAVEATNSADDAFWELRRRIAPIARLARALETRELAGRLKAKGGADWETYQSLLACERRPFARP